MPVVVSKAEPKKDVPVPGEALRRELAMTSVHEPAFSRAFMRMTRGLISPGTSRELLVKLREVEIGKATIEEAVNVIPWFSPAEPLSVKLWNMMAGSISSAYRSTVEDAGEEELRSQGFLVKFTVEKDSHSSTGYVRTKTANLIVEISEQQRELVRDIIATAFEAGLRPESILDQISEAVGLTIREWKAVENRRSLLESADFPEDKVEPSIIRYAAKLLKSRARRIARTETLDAYSQGLQDSWRLARDEGFLPQDAMKEWVEVTASSRTCKICRGLARQRAPLDQPFVSDVIGDVMRPPAHPNCRCTSTLVIPSNPEEEFALATNDAIQARNRLAEG